MNFELTDAQRTFRDRIRRLVSEVVAPRAAAMEEAGAIDPAVIDALRAERFFALTIPAQYGGLDLDSISYCLAVEETARASAAISIMVSVHNSVCAWPIARFGSEELKQRVLPELAAGHVGGFCQTEAEAGSDPGSMGSTALRDGDDYVLNGTKLFVTNGMIADYLLVMAKTDPSGGSRGITAFVVEKGSEGVEVGRREKKIGMRASDTVEVTFRDCRVPAANRLAGEGEGFRIGMTALDMGRIGVGAQATGIALAALDRVAVACRRRLASDGADLREFVADVQELLADMETELAAARLMVLRAAWLKDQGGRFTSEAAQAKLLATETATRVTDRAIRFLGERGVLAEGEVERLFRDARITEIYEGTSEIQRFVIAREFVSRVQSEGPVAEL